MRTLVLLVLVLVLLDTTGAVARGRKQWQRSSSNYRRDGGDAPAGAGGSAARGKDHQNPPTHPVAGVSEAIVRISGAIQELVSSAEGHAKYLVAYLSNASTNWREFLPKTDL